MGVVNIDPVSGFVNLCFGVYNATEGQTSYMSDLDPNWSSLMDMRSKLTKKRQEVESQIADGEASTGASGWVDQAKREEKELHLIQGPIETPRALPFRCLCCYPCFCVAYNLGRRVSQSLVRVGKLMEDPPFPVQQSPATAQVIRLCGPEMVVLQQKLEDCLKLLQEDSNSFIRIQGMGGAGKSTFLINLNNQLLQNRRGFDIVIWVDLSAHHDIRRIHDAIGRRLGLSWPETTPKEERGGDIYKALKNKKFLLLIDDLRGGLNFSDLGVPHPSSNLTPSSKVVFTSRDGKLWHNFGVKEVELSLLDSEDARDLFRRSVGEETLATQEISQIADELAYMCEGLPLALVTVGRSMSGNTNIEDWNTTKHWLSNPATAHAESEREVLRCLRVGYDRLKSSSESESVDQKCFLYCSLFHKDHYIQKEELIRHWIVQGFLKGRDQTLADAHDCGCSKINRLKVVHLLMSGKDKSSVRMHHLVHGMASWVACGDGEEAQKEKFFLKSNTSLVELPDEEGWECVTRMSLVKAKIAKLKKIKIKCPRLSTLIIKNSQVQEIADDFFDSMQELRLLDLEGWQLRKFPRGIHALTKLEYLNLSHSNISNLPVDVKNLKKLKFMDLSFTHNLRVIQSQVLSHLCSLRWLNMYYCGCSRSEQGISMSGISYRYLLDEVKKLACLEYLGVTIKSDRDFQESENFSKLSCMNMLLIAKWEGTTILRLPVIIFVNCLRVLHIMDCLEVASMELNPPAVQTGGTFENLQDVEITNCKVLKDL